MKPTVLVVLILIGLVALFLLYKWLKPYIVKHDTTLLFTGGLGSGKTLESVKTAIVLLRKNRLLKYKIPNKIRKIQNFFIAIHNKKAVKHPIQRNGKKRTIKEFKEYRKKPMLYSNIPICFKPHWYSKKNDREWSITLEEKHILLLKTITEYSICVIDEFPQFVNQFMWGEQLVQDNLNEWITFYRHYVAGYLIVNAQSESEIEVHVRRKLNQAIWCYDFKKWFFGLFYTNRMLDIMLSENISTMSTTQATENTKLHFGIFPPRNTYDSRCYSVRYENTLEKATPRKRWEKLKTYKVLRLKEYISPLDIETTNKQKEQMKKQIEKLSRKVDKTNEETK